MKKHKSKSISQLADRAIERNISEQEKNKEKEQIQKNKAPETEQKQKALMLNTAFIPKWFTKFQVALFLALTAMFVTYLVIKYPTINTLISIGLIIASLALSAFLMYVISRFLKALYIYKERRWLKRFPLNWTQETYTDILSREFFNIKLILRIKFRSFVKENKQKQIMAAAETLTLGKFSEETQLIWTADDIVEIISPEIRAYKYHHPGGYEPYNRQIHLWFKYVIENVVSTINREHLIKELNFSTEKKDRKEIFSKRTDF